MYGYPRVSAAAEYKILFSDPDKIVGKERCSKYLDPKSSLIKDVLAKIRSRIAERYAVNQERPWHIELVDPLLVKGKDPRLKTLERARTLHGKSIRIRQSDFIFMSPRALVLRLPPITGYHKLTHITVAYLDDATDANERIHREIHEIVGDVLTR